MLELYPGSGYSIRLQLNAKTRSESRQKVPDTTGSETLEEVDYGNLCICSHRKGGGGLKVHYIGKRDICFVFSGGYGTFGFKQC